MQSLAEIGEEDLGIGGLFDGHDPSANSRVQHQFQLLR
jgi:hypothetical protein